MAKRNIPPSSSDDFNIRDYLEVSFDSVHLELQGIKDKTDKTDASVQGIIRTINQMKLTDATHYQNCPNTLTIAVLEKKISEYDFIKKYWKVFAGAAILAVIGAVGGYIITLSKINEIITKQKINNTTENGISSEKSSESNSVTTYKYPVR